MSLYEGQQKQSFKWLDAWKAVREAPRWRQYSEASGTRYSLISNLLWQIVAERTADCVQGIRRIRPARDPRTPILRYNRKRWRTGPPPMSPSMTSPLRPSRHKRLQLQWRGQWETSKQKRKKKRQRRNCNTRTKTMQSHPLFSRKTKPSRKLQLRER